MAYADTDFYINTYGGTLPAGTALENLLARATDDIDSAVYGHIGAQGGFAALTAFCQRQVQFAVCAQADHLQAAGGLADLAGVDSYQVGDVSLKLQSGSFPRLAPRARRYLEPTSLLCRGV